MSSWKTLSRRTVLDYGRFLKVEEHAVQISDGRVIPDWTWIITPDFINVVVVTVDEKFLLFRQDKYAVQGISLAPVGGYIEPGEDPLACAQRELREETGYQADEWIPLAQFPVDGNRGAGHAYFFLARGAQLATQPHPDDLETQELLLLSRTEVQAALAAGEFKLLPWAAAVALALLRLSP